MQSERDRALLRFMRWLKRLHEGDNGAETLAAVFGLEPDAVIFEPTA